MVVMTMVVMVLRGGKCRSSKRHHQKGSSDELLQGMNVA
jgi:hypothetical protein